MVLGKGWGLDSTFSTFTKKSISCELADWNYHTGHFSNGLPHASGHDKEIILFIFFVLIGRSSLNMPQSILYCGSLLRSVLGAWFSAFRSTHKYKGNLPALPSSG